MWKLIGSTLRAPNTKLNLKVRVYFKAASERIIVERDVFTEIKVCGNPQKINLKKRKEINNAKCPTLLCN